MIKSKMIFKYDHDHSFDIAIYHPIIYFKSKNLIYPTYSCLYEHESHFNLYLIARLRGVKRSGVPWKDKKIRIE